MYQVNLHYISPIINNNSQSASITPIGIIAETRKLNSATTSIDLINKSNQPNQIDFNYLYHFHNHEQCYIHSKHPKWKDINQFA